MNIIKMLAILLAALFSATSSIRAAADTFGSGVSAFDIEFVDIGNTSNLPDTTGAPNPAGAVLDPYRIGKFEISEQMIVKANTLGGLGITKDARGPDKPATSVSWNEAARFVNWLNTSTGSAPAYKFAIQPGEPGYNTFQGILLWTPSEPGYNPNNLYRNSKARYFLPSADEWYKAAYYNPGSGAYFDYATGSNLAPTSVPSGTAAGTAVYSQPFAAGPADVTLAGGLSPYGTMGQGGNVFEWQESDFDMLNGPTLTTGDRGIRGGRWDTATTFLLSSSRLPNSPSNDNTDTGFRVASVPEPSAFLLGAAGSLGLLGLRLKRRASGSVA